MEYHFKINKPWKEPIYRLRKSEELTQKPKTYITAMYCTSWISF